jgi:hypothetical protein
VFLAIERQEIRSWANPGAVVSQLSVICARNRRGLHYEPVDPALARIRRNAAHYHKLSNPGAVETVAAVVSMYSKFLVKDGKPRPRPPNSGGLLSECGAFSPFAEIMRY